MKHSDYTFIWVDDTSSVTRKHCKRINILAINVFYADCFMYQCNASVGDGANDSKYGDNIVPIHDSTA